MSSLRNRLRRAFFEPKILAGTAVGLGILGFVDATYLTIAHYTGMTLLCTIVHGCDTATKSAYAVLYGIPVALFGMLYYFTIVALGIAYFDTKKTLFLSILSSFTVLGLLASIWFVFLQIVVIKALCLYCMISATTSSLLFLLGVHMRAVLFTAPSSSA